jgi:hypothetical protein
MGVQLAASKTYAVSLTLTALSFIAVACGGRGPATVSAREDGTADLRDSKHYTVKQIVPLVMPSSIPLGLVSHVEMSSIDGDVYASDFGSTNAVYRFSRTGAYKTAYDVAGITGKSQPGQRLVDFAILGSQLYFLLPKDLFVYDLESSHEIKSFHFAGHTRQLVVVTHDICVLTDASAQAIWCADQNLGGARALPYGVDPRILTYAYEQFRPGAVSSSGIFVVGDVYSPTLFVYDPATSRASNISFPGSAWDAAQFDGLWRKSPLTERTRRDIKMGVRRFEKLFALNDGRILLLDLQRDPAKHQWVLYDPKSNRLVRATAGPEPLVFGKLKFSLLDLLVGSSSPGLILGLWDDESAKGLAASMNAPDIARLCTGGLQCLLVVEPSGL